MLPEDAKSRKRIENNKTRQSSVTEHFGPEDPTSKPIPFTNKAFQAAAFEWLIETNQVRLDSVFPLTLMYACIFQPIQAFNHPAFKKMVDLASRANRSIQLPKPKQARSRLIKMFKQQLLLLRERLNVCFF